MASNREDEIPRADSLPAARPCDLVPRASNQEAKELEGDLPGHWSSADSSAQACPSGSLLQSLQRRWRLALTLGLVLGGIAAGAAWNLRPAKYTTFALVKVDSERQELLPRDRVVNDLELYRMTQTALLKSPKVLQTALRQEKIRQLSLVADQPDPTDWLENALVAEPIRNTELLRVSLSGPNPDDIAAIVNAVVQVYLQEVVNRDQKQRLDRLKDLKEVCEKSEEKIRRQRKKLQTVAESLKASDHETAALRQKVALEEYIALRKELITLGSELRQVSKTKEAGMVIEASGELPATAEPAIEQALDDHPDVREQHKKLVHTEEALRKIKTLALPGFQGISDAEEAVRSAREALDALRSRLKHNMAEKVRQRATAEARLLAGKQGERESLLKEQFETIWKEVEDRRKLADQIGLAAILYETERSEIDQAEKIIKSLWTERERLEVEGRSTAQRVMLEVEATPPHTKNRKSQILAAALAGLALFGAGALAVAWWDLRTRRIHSREEVVQDLRLRVLGSLPLRTKLPVLVGVTQASGGEVGSGGSGPQLGLTVRPSRVDASSAYLWTEALTGLRTVLLHEANHYDLRVVLITSAGPEEGKTTLASQLAVSLATAGRRTLLIDADLRCPVLHNLFGVQLAPGLCEVLHEECDPGSAIQPTAAPGLDLLPAGTFSDSVLQLLAQGRFEGLLRPLRDQYDTIVIDSSPVMAVNDALLIGQHSDAVLLSIRPYQSRILMIHETCERLRALDIPVLGTVLNGLKTCRRDLHYRYVPSTVAPAARGQKTCLSDL